MSEARLTARREVDARVGLVIFLAATTMLFASLLLAYAILRAQAGAWPAAGAAAFPRRAAGENTLLLLAAGLTLRRAKVTGAVEPMPGPLVATGVLGAGFLAGQAMLWHRLVAAHLGPGSGALGDTFFALSILHAAHVLGGLAALPLVGRRRISALVLYWDFVAVVWLVIYVGVCWL